MNINKNSNVLKKYRIVQLIGEGGFSQVYKIEKNNPNQHFSNEFYALKYVNFEGRPDIEINKKRFKQEIEIYKKIKSNKIPAYIDSYIDEKEQYLIMEYVEGKTLREIINQEGKVSSQTAVYIIKQIAEGLMELHNCKILHRDIKSANIILTNKKEVKIIDFGLALGEDSQRYTKDTKVVGTVYYMAPELCVSNAIPTVQSDIYALGILLFELLTGRYPIKGKNAQETIKKQKNSPMPDINKEITIPIALSNIITRSTAKDPNKRYKSMYEMYLDLKTCLDPKRYYESPLDLKKIKVKNKMRDFIYSKSFIITSSIIFFLLLILGIGLIIKFIN
ncbi:serine/threonine-protein kinase [Mycoplasmopsis lipofaciens]|uniref:serine/threonine-protein kinase n=1 Tax=Mycoplasmopsis lipofaciens TaxID=114884 RepID=UPI000487129A|nr:serine/threonine-protein kinase [Mycoplasmopsis lipofaciens]